MAQVELESEEKAVTFENSRTAGKPFQSERMQRVYKAVVAAKD